MIRDLIVMYFYLNFDFDKKLLYVPDGYIYDIGELKNSFYEWVTDTCLIEINDRQNGLFFDSSTFIEYLNSVVLKDTNEKAFIISKCENIKKQKRFKTIDF